MCGLWISHESSNSQFWLILKSPKEYFNFQNYWCWFSWSGLCLDTRIFISSNWKFQHVSQVVNHWAGTQRHLQSLFFLTLYLCWIFWFSDWVKNQSVWKLYLWCSSSLGNISLKRWGYYFSLDLCICLQTSDMCTAGKGIQCKDPTPMSCLPNTHYKPQRFPWPVRGSLNPRCAPAGLACIWPSWSWR